MGRKSEVYTATVNIGEMTREEAASKDVTNEAAANERELNNGLEVAVKLSRQPPNSVSEIEVIKKGKDARAKHLPELVECKDLLELCVKDGIREAFGKCGVDDVDNRVPRCIVAPRYTALSEQLRNNPDSLVEMAKQMIKCIDDLRYKAKILHRDISEGNIMYTRTDEGKDRFILIDFDPSVGVNETYFRSEQSAYDRTGTLPFMAWELVPRMRGRAIPQKPVRHCVRHDFESVFWVSLWCAVRLVNPELPDKNEITTNARYEFLDMLERGESDDIANAKGCILSTHAEIMNLPLSPSFKHLRGWLNEFRLPFWNYIIARERVEEDKFDRDCMAELSGSEQPEDSEEAILTDFASYETGYDTITRNTLLEAVGRQENH